MNPLTKYGIRQDSAGSGSFGAGRGNRSHTGIDWLANPGDEIKCPWDTAIFHRIIYPYSDDLSYTGGVYEVRVDGTKYFAIIYYMDISQQIRHKHFYKGDVLGTAQNVAQRYNKPTSQLMKNHIHVEMYKVFDYTSLIK